VGTLDEYADSVMDNSVLPKIAVQYLEEDKQQLAAEQEARKQAEDDNAVLVCSLQSIAELKPKEIDTPYGKKIGTPTLKTAQICATQELSKPHPGADLLAEMDQYKKALELACKRISLLQCQDLSMTDEFMKNSLFKAKEGEK